LEQAGRCEKEYRAFSRHLKIHDTPGGTFPRRSRVPANSGGRFEEKMKNRHPCFFKNKGVAIQKVLKNARLCPGEQK